MSPRVEQMNGKCVDCTENRQNGKPLIKPKPKDFFQIIPKTTVAVLSTLFITILGATLRGEWIFVLVHIHKQFSSAEDISTSSSLSNSSSLEVSIKENLSIFDGVLTYIFLSVAVSFITFYGGGGYLQYAYYIKRRDKPEEWKCQPEKFLSPDNERHEIMMGSINMVIGGTISGIIAAYIINGGYTTLYFTMGEKGYPYLILSSIFFFIIQDALAFYAHKTMHIAWVYKNFHKWHHRYHQPTAFSCVAMHPVEFLTLQFAQVVPAFIMPLYSGTFIMTVMYNYYYGMVDHSGIKMDAFWPWQPDTMFHDDHHKHFHVNFGFNLKIWDWMHDTLKKENRIYGEDIFGGKGKQKGS